MTKLSVAATFMLLLSAFDLNAQTYSRTEAITYHDNTAKWVVGQTATVTCVASVPASVGCDGNDVMQQTTYDANTALPIAQYAFGKLQQSYSYNADGTLSKVMDGRGQATTLSSWKLGVPQLITHPDGKTQKATVIAPGLIASLTDENGHVTSYRYDAMGRLSGITYPGGDSAAWQDTNRSFVSVNAVEYGIAAGHWRLTETTGNAAKVTYYDGMWRPLLVREYDSSNVAATERFVRYAYDAEGRVSFQSYPSTSSNPTTGVWTSYDTLGRVTSVAQDSELGLLVTTTDYLPNFQVRVTNPRGNAVVTSYLAYDQPATDWPVLVNDSAGQSTSITRDPYGKPLSISRGSVTRSYTYDMSQMLCRSVEPETGATLYGYDAAGNLAWSAAGLPAAQACSSGGGEAAVLARRVARSYDARNRLMTLTFPDGNGNQSWSYAPDGLPVSVTTSNNGNLVSNAWSYNKRRLLTSETMTPDALQGWVVTYGYNGLAQRISESGPAGLVLNYTVNALGQATQVTGSTDGGTAKVLASNASYYPNGALKQFTYGNGIVHTMTQNVRQLPARSIDGNVLNLAVSYDANGNVTGISDATASGRQTRTMAYDMLDRLVSASSPMFGTASYVYDAQDNLLQAGIGPAGSVKTRYYCYNANNQLEFLRLGPNCSGNASPAETALGYDPQGNVLFKNGARFAFDFGNRLRSTAGLSYRYDADGRRVRQDSNGAQLLYSHYAKDGRLLWQRDEVTGKRINNVYFAGSLLAEISRPIGATTATITYLHTDALGSPIAKSNAGQGVIETSEYEPFGKLLNRANDNRAGYTGHVMDGVSGLTYMQQRYYDPMIGRFLSVDPVTAYEKPLTNFNRYVYALNNPYKFTDPDGRDVVFSVDPNGAVGNGHTSLYFQDAKGNWYKYDQGAAGDGGSSGDYGFVSGRSTQAGVTIQPVDAKSVPSDGLRISTTSKQDAKISDSAVKSADAHNSGKVEYNLYSNNCTDAAVDVVNGSGAGITVSNSATTVKPNTWMSEVKNDKSAVKIEDPDKKK